MPRPARRRQVADDRVLAALIVPGRPEPPPRRPLGRKPLEEAVEGQVEVEARLLAVADGVEPGVDLILHRDRDRIVHHLGDIVGAEGLQVSGRELEPRRERVAADDGRAQGVRHAP